MSGNRVARGIGLAVAVALSAACRDQETVVPVATVTGPPRLPPYTVSERGGTPATGPGDRYNRCERIWCSSHRENFFVTHYLEDHRGWIVHDDARGDVYLASDRTSGPGFPRARPTALRLCGLHLHPWLLEAGSRPIRHTGFNRALEYSRSHYATFGTRLDPCCPNGLGWAYVHTSSGRQFRFHDVEDYRAHPERGWSKPFAAKVSGP